MHIEHCVFLSWFSGQAPNAMNKTARNCRASPSDAGCEQCLAILPWRFEPCLVARGDHYRLLLVAGSAIAAGSIKRRRHAFASR
jgi:hypothetical protein